MEAPWTLKTQLRANAIARSFIKQTVIEPIRLELNESPTAYEMWTLLRRRYSVMNNFEGHRIMNEVTKLKLEKYDSAVAFIRAVQVLRERCESAAPSLAEFYWTSTTLHKLLEKYPTETKFLMSQRGITLEDICAYFSELVFDFGDPWDTQFLQDLSSGTGQIPGRSSAGNRVPPTSSQLSSKSKTGIYAATENSSSARQSSERYIPLRAYNPLVPILVGPRIPPPWETPEEEDNAPGVRCVGCGMAGHSTYNCPFFNIPLCHGCKRFGHRRSQCKPEWVKELPGDKVMPSPPERPPDSALPKSGFKAKFEEGKVLHLSCCAAKPPPTPQFIVDSELATMLCPIRTYSVISYHSLKIS